MHIISDINDKGQKRFRICKYMILVIQVGVMIFLCSIKPAINEDEIWTFFISNRFVVKPDMSIDSLNSWSSIAAINDVMWISPGHLFDYSFIRSYVPFDVHPPLYNIILHTICSVCYPLGFSLWYGYGLNIVISALNYLLVNKIGKILFKSEKIGLFIGIIYAFSIGTFNTVLFIRFYILASFFVLNALYLHLQFYYNGKRRYYIYILANTLLGMLTFYPYGIYQLFLTVSFLIALTRKKEYKVICKYIIVLLISGLLFFILFPESIQQVLYGTPGSGFRDPNRNYFIDLVLFVQIISKELFGNTLIVFILILTILGFFQKKRNVQYDINVISILAVPIIGYLLIINHLAPFNTTGRYHFIIYPIIIIAIYGSLGYLLCQCNEGKFKWKNLTTGVLAIILLPVVAFYIYSNPLNNIEYLMYGVKGYNQTASKYAGMDCICIFDESPLKLYINYSELKNFENIFFTNSELLKQTDDLRLEQENEVIVYITQGLNEKEIIQELLYKNPRLKNIVQVYQRRYADVLYLSN